MKRKETKNRGLAVLFPCCAVLLSLSLAAPTLAADEERIKVEKRVVVRCDGDGCDGDGDAFVVDLEELGDRHGFAWVSGDGPGHMALRMHVAGGFLGVQLAELTPELRQHFGVDENAGVMISKVVEDSPAARAGLLVGDIVSAVDSEPVGSGNALGQAIRDKEDGDAALLEVWRDGSVLQLTATIEERQSIGRKMDWSFVMDCDDNEEDCSFQRRKVIHGKHHGGFDHYCDEGGPCEVKIQCDGETRDDCECTVNGETVECTGVHGLDD